MNRELENLREKGTWQEVRTPPNRKKIGAKWVLKIKRDAEGNIVKYKARLVAKGYSQVPGVDFEETYCKDTTFLRPESSPFHGFPITDSPSAVLKALNIRPYDEHQARPSCRWMDIVTDGRT
jgi:hypothetical protein